MEVLSYGVPVTIADTVIRGLPPQGGHLFVTVSTATSFDLSNSPTMANPMNVAAAATAIVGGFAYSGEVGARVSANYIRVNGGTAIVKITKQ
jgi:hypothetical protein